MKFFDFHSHPVLKQLFNDNPNIDSLIYRSDVATLPALCSDLPTIIESQTHQSQLADFQDEVIIGAALYSVESYVAKAVIPLRKYLKQNSQFKLSQKVLEDAKDNSMKPFKDFLMDRTLKKYLQSPSYNVLTKAVLVKRFRRTKSMFSSRLKVVILW